MVTVAITKIVVITTITNRSGFLMKKSGHEGLIMPIIKNKSVKMPVLKAALIKEFIDILITC